MRVSPTAIAPRMSARCDTDLSPGTVARPLSAALGRAASGRKALLFAIGLWHFVRPWQMALRACFDRSPRKWQTAPPFGSL